VALFRVVPDRRELQRFDLEAALFERFLGDVLGRGQVHVGPAAGQGPAAAVGGQASYAISFKANSTSDSSLSKPLR
jgi:hypothetical protein